MLGRDEKYLDRTDSGQSVIQEIIQRDRSETIDEETDVESDDAPVHPVKKDKQILIQEQEKSIQEQNESHEIELLIESHHFVYSEQLTLGTSKDSKFRPRKVYRN